VDLAMVGAGLYMFVWSILWPFDTFCGHLNGYLVCISFARLGMLYQEKSGNPGQTMLCQNVLQQWHQCSEAAYFLKLFHNFIFS
jgi:hypothetical protein